MTAAQRSERPLSASMVLIHGAWQGSWAWDAWIPELAARGWHAHAVDLPGNGVPGTPQAAAHASMQSGIALLEQTLSSTTAPVVVVAHSGAGILASQLAEHFPERVACVVYVAGMMLPSGMAYAQLVSASLPDVPGAAGIAPYLEWSEDLSTSTVPPAAALQIFVHDCAPDHAREAAARLRPQQESGRALVASLTPERFGRVPRIYIEALKDRSILLPVQRRMQALVPGAIVHSINCGHVPHLARPGELADIVCSALRELGIEPLSKPHAVSENTRPTEEPKPA